MELPLTKIGDEAGILTAFDQMVEAVEQFRQQLRRTERLATLGKFSALIAHEIKNPLAGISANIQVARMKARESGEQEALLRALDYAHEETVRTTKVLSKIMTFAHSEIVPTLTIDLATRLRHSLSILTPLMETAGVTVQANIPEVRIPCVGDGDTLHQVIQNLTQNAMYAMRNASVRNLIVTLDSTDSLVNVRISDTGEGMSDETKARLFEPFFTTKPSGVGTGLGLALCQGIINSHRGSLTVESVIGQGTTFEIRLPLAQEVK